MFKKSFKLIRQLDVMDCGPACLMMIGLHHGKKYSLNRLRQLCDKGQQGVTLLGINRAAEELDFKTLPMKMTIELFVQQAQLPCLVHWQGDHYVVVYKISKGKITIADPGVGKATLSTKQFTECWTQGKDTGIVLFVEPTQKFYQNEDDQHRVLLNSILASYLAQYGYYVK